MRQVSLLGGSVCNNSCTNDDDLYAEKELGHKLIYHATIPPIHTVLVFLNVFV